MCLLFVDILSKTPVFLAGHPVEMTEMNFVGHPLITIISKYRTFHLSNAGNLWTLVMHIQHSAGQKFVQAFHHRKLVAPFMQVIVYQYLPRRLFQLCINNVNWHQLFVLFHSRLGHEKWCKYADLVFGNF